MGADTSVVPTDEDGDDGGPAATGDDPNSDVTDTIILAARTNSVKSIGSHNDISSPAG